MSLLKSFIDTVTIKPLELFFEVIFSLACQVTVNPGLSIIVLSILMNLILMPMYRRADAIQAEEHAIETKMKAGVDHIRKTFKGDEAFMMLQTYYRQNNYKPSNVLKGSLPLLLEIPFFIAAYRFISSMTLLQGTPFGPIRDLGAPDASFLIGSFSVNLLPILMTVINIVSGMIYTKGYSLKTKIQLYTMAGLFLVLLYDSPAGLVLYWTMNNLFSLVKNVITANKKEKKAKAVSSPKVEAPSYLFWMGNVFLTIMLGILIPSSVVHSSPAEFTRFDTAQSPLHYILNSTFLSIGFFLVWFGIFYLMADKRRKQKITFLTWVLSGFAVVNYMFFATKLGNLSPFLKFDNPVLFTIPELLINAGVLVAVFFLLKLLYNKKNTLVSLVYSSAILAFCVMSFMNIRGIQSELTSIPVQETVREEAQIPLHKNGENVIVLMLDRALSQDLPYIFAEKPELKEKFAGFTYYPNATSFGTHTNTGAPALFGGYEYTPEAMNARIHEKLKDKHNEAIKVMPALFYENDFEVTVCDPPYANYNWIPDLSIYDDYPDMHTYITKGFYTDSWLELSNIIESGWTRNFFCYSLMKASPLLLQPVLYNAGYYNEWRYALHDSGLGMHSNYGLSTSVGLNTAFLDSYLVLDNLPEISPVSDSSKNTFMMMVNETTHEATLLQKPDYTPAFTVNNKDFDGEDANSITVDGQTLHLDTSLRRNHFHSNMASMLKLAEWFDYMRENEVYDNTRIILVSDHGYTLNQFKDQILPNDLDVGSFRCLLMVKDFGETEYKTYKTDEKFMTVADVPELASEGVVQEQVNPFTQRAFTSVDKEGPVKVFDSNHWQISENNGYSFIPDDWYEVQGDVRNAKNWKYLGEY